MNEYPEKSGVQKLELCGLMFGFFLKKLQINALLTNFNRPQLSGAEDAA